MCSSFLYASVVPLTHMHTRRAALRQHTQQLPASGATLGVMFPRTHTVDAGVCCHTFTQAHTHRSCAACCIHMLGVSEVLACIFS